MANPDYIQTEGWDRYGPVGYPLTATDLGGDEWTQIINNGVSPSPTVVAALDGTGFALQMNGNGGTAQGGPLKTLSSNFARSVGGTRINAVSTTSTVGGIQFYDGATAQFSLGVNTLGQIVAHRGGLSATVIATSTETMTLNAPHTLEWDITFHNTAGIIKVWLDGVLTSLNLTTQDCCATVNNFFNGWSPQVFNGTVIFDHTYMWAFTASGGSETPALTNSVIETQFPAADSTVQFTIGQDILGEGYRLVTSTATPAANSLVLRPFVAGEAATLNSVTVVPNVTSAAAKLKPVVYADSAGAPAALLTAGSEVIGTAAGVALNMPVTTPQALVGGATYWIGYITDTAFALRVVDANATGYRAANTYASGAPNPAPAMTSGQGTWLMWGVIVPTALHYTQLTSPVILGDLSYNFASVVNKVENFTFPGLVSTPTTIYSLGLKVTMERSDAGARTVDLQTISGASTSTGNKGSGVTPSTSYQSASTYYFTDPATGVAWTSGGLGSAIHGIKIAS